MPNSLNRKSINLDKCLCERFSYLYPKVMKTFIERALVKAVQDRRFFESVYFLPEKLEIK